MPKDSPDQLVLERLDAIADHLRNLDRRDRMRMIGSSIRNVLHIGFLIFVVWSSVYLLQHMGEIIKTVAQETAKQTMQYSKEGSADFLQQMQDMFKN